MKIKNFLKVLVFLVGFFLFTFSADAGEVIGDGTNGFFVHSMSPNVGFFKMELTNQNPFHGEKSQKFWIHSLGNGSVKIRKTYTNPIPRENYSECVAFKNTYDLTPPVNNVFMKLILRISGDNQNFFYVGAYHSGREGMGYWSQMIMGFQSGNAPSSIVATEIEFQLYFTGTPSTDSIRTEYGLDYWSFSFYSYPKVIIDDFEGIPSGVIQNQNEIPEKFNLSQNYPNPFNPLTVISFKLPVSSLATLKVYNVLGKEVATLVNEKLNAGSYEIDFDAGKLTSGTYFYRLIAGEFVETKKMILMK